MTDRIERVLAYHQRTKHHLHRYAVSPDQLDWATQPDPFRTFAGATVIELPLLADACMASFGDLDIPGRIAPRRLDVSAIAIFFELALGLSAWKEYGGSRWALRCNPSSGNLHPTEGYAVVPAIPGLAAGVYHYISRDHLLERRCALEARGAETLAGLLPAGCFLAGLSSIHWREAWKYGERAFRYCQHDIGHALAALRYAAACLGWVALLLEGPGDADVAAWLGLDRTADFTAVAAPDREHPDALILIGSPPLTEPVLPPCPPQGIWSGRPNSLSPAHISWEAIDEVAERTQKERTELVPPPILPALPSLGPGSTVAAATLIRQRRSCLALDGRTAVDASTLYRMLDHLLPRPGIPPWDVVPWQPRLHLALFVHRVTGLTPGLYFFERRAQVHDEIRAACSSGFSWQRTVDCPDHLRLFFLAAGDCRALAQQVSCDQDIAADGAFSLGMIAEFGDPLRRFGAWFYRRLFWEAGVLGQVLYLQAEAAGVRGTGIGCYFDDAIHHVLGLSGDRFVDLYHFTVGGPAEDRRLRTIAPYAHLDR